jgi:hypothetical protein
MIVTKYLVQEVVVPQASHDYQIFHSFHTVLETHSLDTAQLDALYMLQYQKLSHQLHQGIDKQIQK